MLLGFVRRCLRLVVRVGKLLLVLLAAVEPAARLPPLNDVSSRRIFNVEIIGRLQDAHAFDGRHLDESPPLLVGRLGVESSRLAEPILLALPPAVLLLDCLVPDTEMRGGGFASVARTVRSVGGLMRDLGDTVISKSVLFGGGCDGEKISERLAAD